MSKRAEEIAYEIYPAHSSTAVLSSAQVDLLRMGCIKGYEQAEKDLSLTWEDVRTLFKIAYNYEDDAIEKPPYLSQEYCEEILRRFNEQKK